MTIIVGNVIVIGGIVAGIHDSELNMTKNYGASIV